MKVARRAELTRTTAETARDEAARRATGAERIETARRVALAAHVTLPGWTLATTRRHHP